MPTGQASPKSSAKVTYFWIQSEADVIPAMSALLSINHDSQLRAFKQNGVDNWQLIVEDRRPETPPEKSVKPPVTLGDVLVWDGVQITVMRKEEFLTKYSVP